MSIKSPFLKRTKAADLPTFVPKVPVFEGEEALDAVSTGQKFLGSFANAVNEADWDTFKTLFDDQCFWKDALTLTFDKRTLNGREAIVDAWKSTYEPRQPVIYTDGKDFALKVSTTFRRLTPQLATLDVPFCFRTQRPDHNCVGLAKLVPKPDGSWKIWVLATHFVSLVNRPNDQLPKPAYPVIRSEQRGQSRAQGLPNLDPEEVLDAAVVGASAAGVAVTTQLEAYGAKVVAFDMLDQAGGNWSGPGKAYVTLHHMPSMMTLPQYPLPEDHPADMTGYRVTKYVSDAVAALKLPVFCGIKVLSNAYDENTKLWDIEVEDTKSQNRMKIKSRNIVLCMGSIVSADNPKYPNMTDRDHFKGPVQHGTEYKDATPFRDKDVIVVGASNSAHDIARNLAEGGANKVTVLQRGPTSFIEWKHIGPIMEGPYLAHKDDFTTADFVASCTPLGVMRTMANGAMSGIEVAQAAYYSKIESKGYSIQKWRDLIAERFDNRNQGLFMDRQRTMELVFNDRIQVARGEAVRYTDNGIIVRDLATDEERQLHAEGLVLATGFQDIDMVQHWVDSGFLKSKFADQLENPCTLDIDQEGELIGYVTNSGHPHLYNASYVVIASRWAVSVQPAQDMCNHGELTDKSNLIAAQIMADIDGEFPERLSRAPIANGV